MNERITSIRKRIGILGGTFDPIHIGHLLVAQAAQEELGLDEVIFIPAGQPWMKGEQVAADATDRLQMVKLGVGSHMVFSSSAVEIERPGPSYTVDTLEALHNAQPDTDLFLLLGLDALLELHRWHSPERILQLVSVAAAPRPDYGSPSALVEHEVFPRLPQLKGRLHLLQGPQVDISASGIRQRVKESRPIKYLVPEAVEAYIRWKRLYV